MRWVAVVSIKEDPPELRSSCEQYLSSAEMIKVKSHRHGEAAENLGTAWGGRS
jgi:hypothetical protein